MPIRLTDTIIPYLVDRLETQLPAIVTAINTQSLSMDPQTPISVPQSVFDYVPALGDLYAFPVLGISDGPIDLVDDQGWGATGQGEITVVIFEQDSDLRTLAWKLRRQQQAVVRAIRTPTIILGDAWGTYNYRVVPGPTLSRNEGPRQFVSTSAVSFMFKSEQDV